MSSGHEPPVALDSLIGRENVAPSESLPSDVTVLRRQWSMLLSRVAEGDETEPASQREVRFRKASGDTGFATWSIDFPNQVTEGVLGTAPERLSPHDVGGQVGEESRLGSYRPPWTELSWLPKPAAPATDPPLRRLKGSLVTPECIFGNNDDRKVYYPSGWPWHCIGKLWVWKGNVQGLPTGAGTGVLVGKKVVLTAGHVAPWGWGPGQWKMLFVPASYDGSSIYGAGFQSWVSSFNGYNVGSAVAAWDMAVLRLSAPLGTALGYFNVMTYSSTWQGQAYWTLCGYPDDVAGGNRPSYQQQISVLDDDAEGNALEIEHNGDTNKGNSGGPLWSWWGADPRIIGTVSGCEWESPSGNTNVAAGGSPLTQLVNWARVNWDT